MSAVVLAEERPVARKAHVCEACFGIIRAGDRYYSQRYVYDDQIGSWKLHESCLSLYWAMHRDAGLWEDDAVDPEELRDVWLGLFAWMAGR